MSPKIICVCCEYTLKRGQTLLGHQTFLGVESLIKRLSEGSDLARRQVIKLLERIYLWTSWP